MISWLLGIVLADNKILGGNVDELTENELERYDRQIILEGFGEEGQKKLKRAKVFIAGSGGLASSISFYLAVAGVGKMRIVDHGKVELSNLNRQILHWEKDIGREKVNSAGEKLAKLNSSMHIECVIETISEHNVFELVGDYELIVDAVDNFPTRYILNKAAIAKGIPFFHGAVRGFDGRAMTVIPGKTPCLKCLYSRVPAPEKFPVVGVTPGVIGCIQAAEVIKYIVGVGNLLAGRLLVYDGLNQKFTEVNVRRDPECGHCGQIASKGE